MKGFANERISTQSIGGIIVAIVFARRAECGGNSEHYTYLVEQTQGARL
jgi:hypothetical protein